ncbi:uncharacterized protein LODBEIA_P10740 [Lodderomyces beijingensis]|uniref:Mitochondrial thiamine pyrophosphate carrier 1 n=1 Tax=Lodderomyces beijingensis TaxID=1775926 RepID=A0ABP0ZFA5_9ASCO
MSGNFPRAGGNIPSIVGDLDHKHAIHVFPQQLQPFRSSIIAYGASLASTLVGYPMDTVKVRMQTHKHYTNYIDCFVKTYKTEGVRGFFRGVWAPLISTSFSKSISVSIYTATKPYVYDILFSYPAFDVTSNAFLKNLPACFVSGFIAGGCVSIFACPFEFIKIFAQLERLVQSKSPLRSESQRAKAGIDTRGPSTSKIVQTIVKYGGWRGLYSGFYQHFLRDSISTGIYYSFYESMKWSINVLTNESVNKPSATSVLLAGGLSGVFSWILIFPMDTAKSLVQKDAVSTIVARKYHLPQESLRASKQASPKKHYRGLGISVTRSFITNMVFFGVFELGMTYLA